MSAVRIFAPTPQNERALIELLNLAPDVMTGQLTHLIQKWGGAKVENNSLVVAGKELSLHQLLPVDMILSCLPRQSYSQKNLPSRVDSIPFAIDAFGNMFYATPDGKILYSQLDARGVEPDFIAYNLSEFLLAIHPYDEDPSAPSSGTPPTAIDLSAEEAEFVRAMNNRYFEGLNSDTSISIDALVADLSKL